MTNSQSRELQILGECQEAFEVGSELVVANRIEGNPRYDYNFHIIHPKGNFFLIHFKGDYENGLKLAIIQADITSKKGTDKMAKTKEEIEEMVENLPETIHCTFCDVDIKRSGYGQHTRSKKHLEAVAEYKKNHPDEVKKIEDEEKATAKAHAPKSSSKAKTSKIKNGGKPPRGAIGEYCLQLLRNKNLAKKTYAELAEMVREKYNSKTSPACLAWYVSKYKNDKTIVPRANSPKNGKKDKK